MRGRRCSWAAIGAVLAAAVVASLSGASAQEAPERAATAGPTREQRLARQLRIERAAQARLAGRLRRQLRAERRLTRLVRHPSPAHNRALARMLYPDAFWALDEIAAGGDGLGGRPGESDWRHDVWNGGARGAWPDRTRPQGRGPCRVGNAYGIGQACPRRKMEAWAGTPAVYEIPSLQIHWMAHYATGRYGSLEAAGDHWTLQGSW